MNEPATALKQPATIIGPLSYAGDYDPTVDYEPGSLVRSYETLYLAIFARLDDPKGHEPGKSPHDWLPFAPASA